VALARNPFETIALIGQPSFNERAVLLHLPVNVTVEEQQNVDTFYFSCDFIVQ